MIHFKPLKKILPQAWSQRSITQQFRFASGSLLMLIGGVTLTSLISLNVIRQKTEWAMGNCIKLQQLVFDMNKTLEITNETEKAFFHEALTVGIDRARQDYLKLHKEQIEKIFQISQQVEKLVSHEELSHKLNQSYQDLKEYKTTIQTYYNSFNKIVKKVEDLGHAETGALAQNQQNFELLGDILQLSYNPELMELYDQMMAKEKAYLITHKFSEKQVLDQIISQIKTSINDELGLTLEEKERAKQYLASAESNLIAIRRLDEEIHKISDDFEGKSEEVSAKLLKFTTDEIKLARQEIQRKSQQMAIILGTSVLAMITLSALILNAFKFALKQLEIEQGKSEDLLLNILPETIVKRLKYKPETIADNFEEATVLFADIAGFTQLSTQISPQELVKLLNEIFSSFDQLTVQKGLEKIKTIGDAYMVVGGLPQPRSDHAQAIADLALDMQSALTQFNHKHGSNLNMRIGINTGPVVAGVIGAKKFIYDLWGDTVNTASRMESHGIVGEIQVTESTYQHLQHHYDLEKRGLISVKGKGEMPTYLLKCKKGTELMSVPR